MHTPLAPQARLVTPPTGRLPRPGLAARYLTAVPMLQRFSVSALRLSLGVVYLWFGALKVADVSPATQLVKDTTVAIGSPSWVVPALGVAEIGIGAWLLLGRNLHLLLPIFVGHLAGTFAVLVVQPAAAFQHGNPLELTATGEFVIKNLVLLAAGLTVLTRR